MKQGNKRLYQCKTHKRYERRSTDKEQKKCSRPSFMPRPLRRGREETDRKGSCIYFESFRKLRTIYLHFTEFHWSCLTILPFLLLKAAAAESDTKPQKQGESASPIEVNWKRCYIAISRKEVKIMLLLFSTSALIRPLEVPIHPTPARYLRHAIISFKREIFV